MSPDSLTLDMDTFRRYAGQALPRHVAYPMPTWWENLDAGGAYALLEHSRDQAAPPDLSIYVHVPFCEQICRYCACNRIALPKTASNAATRLDEYLTAVAAEVQQVLAHAGRRTVKQIHWGGGTPTYLTGDQMKRLFAALADHVTIADDAEIAIEIDPRVTGTDALRTLRELGFNRVSLGVQDFDPHVQQHVRRIQPVEMVAQMVSTCRALGFASVNFDLIYGLPKQTVASVRQTLAQTVALQPDRIAYYQFAQIPDKIAVQRGLDYTALPDSETKFEMFMTGLEVLTAAGYEFIGLDHFARPDEGLARARAAGTIQRNFQGMTTGGGYDLVGIGPSSISHLSQVGYLQNVRQLPDYVARVSANQTPIFRGKPFSRDDCIRQATLGQLYCLAEIRPELIEQEYDLDFDAYFARELAILHELAADGLVQLDGRRIKLTMPLGRVLMRTVAAVFDAYLEPDAYKTGDRQYFSANA
jgi:oxygen-independent coproporphyrinogen III oxidase